MAPSRSFNRARVFEYTGSQYFWHAKLIYVQVTYDEHSLMVYGERVMVFSGEFHPYRLPVPGLWLDIFQKVKALGFNVVSFYVHWALLEGERGVYRADGIFDFEPFFDAASQAGIYLIARPGPVSKKRLTPRKSVC